MLCSDGQPIDSQRFVKFVKPVSRENKDQPERISQKSLPRLGKQELV